VRKKYDYSRVKKNAYGTDLPETILDAQMVALNLYPLFDATQEAKVLRENGILEAEILTYLVKSALPNHLMQLEEAHRVRNWKEISNLARQIESSSLYCGTIGLTHASYACKHLVFHTSLNQVGQLDSLYHRLVKVVKDTKRAVEVWLIKCHL
jgi:hypothetical protein